MTVMRLSVLHQDAGSMKAHPNAGVPAVLEPQRRDGRLSGA